MKVCLAVQEFFTNDVERNLRQIEASANAAKKESAELLCFGEAVLQGFFSVCGIWEKDKDIAVTADSPAIDVIKKIATTNDLSIGFGYIERDGNNIFSSFMVVDKNGGTICNYRRISPGWKTESFGPEYLEGSGYGKFSLSGVDFAVGLCGDFWFDDELLNPENIGAENVLWPVFLDSSYEAWRTDAEFNEYAEHSAKIGKRVFFVNSVLNGEYTAEGRAAFFENGKIKTELEIGKTGLILCDF